MNLAYVVRLTDGMNLADIQREMQKLTAFRTPFSQFHTMQNEAYLFKKNPGQKIS